MEEADAHQLQQEDTYIKNEDGQGSPTGSHGEGSPVHSAKRKTRSGPKSRTSPYVGVSQVENHAYHITVCLR